MPGLAAELGASMLLRVTEHCPVPAVIGLHELEAPVTGGGVPPGQSLLDVLGEGGMPCVA